MTEDQKGKYIDIMTDNLTMLRAKLNLTQEELANVVGLSRYTVISIEKKQRRMTWNTFLSLVLVFSSNPETFKILKLLDVYTDELAEFLGLQSANET